MRTVVLARKLRREMSLPEVLLWQQLKGHPNGLKFRKQHPAGEFVLDFYCPAAKLAIEIDGSAHHRAERACRDKERDDWLARRGVRTLRLPAALVLRDMADAVGAILAAASPGQPLHQPAAGPPPRAGEDFS